MMCYDHCRKVGEANVQTVEKSLCQIADVIAGANGLSEIGQFAYLVVQPNSFTETGVLGELAAQYRKDEVSSDQIIRRGDVLFKRLNPSFVYVTENVNEPTVASPNLLIVRPKDGTDAAYLGFLMEQKDILAQIEHVSGNSAAIKAVSIKKLMEIKVPVPSTEQQKRIGELWRLSKRRKQLLQEYINESDRMMSVVSAQLIKHGG